MRDKIILLSDAKAFGTNVVQEESLGNELERLLLTSCYGRVRTQLVQCTKI